MPRADMVCYLRAAYYFFANMTVRNRWYERSGAYPAAQARREIHNTKKTAAEQPFLINIIQQRKAKERFVLLS